MNFMIFVILFFHVVLANHESPYVSRLSKNSIINDFNGVRDKRYNVPKHVPQQFHHQESAKNHVNHYQHQPKEYESVKNHYPKDDYFVQSSFKEAEPHHKGHHSFGKGHHSKVPVHHSHHKENPHHHRPAPVPQKHHRPAPVSHHHRPTHHHGPPPKHSPVHFPTKHHHHDKHQEPHKHHRLHKRSPTYWNNDYSSNYYPNYSDDWDSSYEHDDVFPNYHGHYDKHHHDDHYYSHYPNYYHDHDHYNGHCPYKKPTYVPFHPPTTTTTTKKPQNPKKPSVEAVVNAVGNAVLDVKDQLLNPGHPQRPGNQVRPVVALNPEHPGVGQQGLFVPVMRPVLSGGHGRNDGNETLRGNDDEEKPIVEVVPNPVDTPDSIDSFRLEPGMDLNGETNEQPKEEEANPTPVAETTPDDGKNARSMNLDDFNIDIRGAANPR